MPTHNPSPFTVTLAFAQPSDLETLRQIAIQAFSEDLKRYGMMPDRIEQIQWHEEGIADGSYLVIEMQHEGAERHIVGGIRIFDLGNGEFRLGSIFVDSSLHGHGIGKKAIEALEHQYPQAATWALDTPAGSTRNHRFYTHAGYVKVGESYPDPTSDFCLFDYEKPRLLGTIRDADLFEPSQIHRHRDESKFVLRQAARAVLQDDAGRVALLHVTKDGYHKLPGGGIEQGEDVYTALQREIREETGAEMNMEVQAIRLIGMTAEYIANYELKQFSYAYSVQVIGVPAKPNFTMEERAEGFTPIWVTPQEALRLMEHDEPTSYSGHFIRRRDMMILQSFTTLFVEKRL